MTSGEPPVGTVSRPRPGPWWWTPSLYFTQALPNVLVMTVSTYAYTRLGVTAVLIGYTAWLGLPWMFKPLWSPLVELVGTERRWVWVTQYVGAAALALVAAGYGSEHFFVWTAAGYAVLAVASATHDIAADGFYMRVLSAHDQTWFTGIRSVAFRGGLIFGEGVLVMLAGRLMRREFDAQVAWAITHGVGAALFFALATYHALVLPASPPKPPGPAKSVLGVLVESGSIFRKFFASAPVVGLVFLLLYRFAEAQLTKFAGKFLLDPRENGGLGLLEEQIGLINGTLGVCALLAGGVLGGFTAARFGLRACLPAMVLLLNVPNLVYVALAHYQPTDLNLIGLGIVVEKFGYGFGFTGYMLYMLYLAQGEHRTSYYAICTGFMTLGLILPGSLAGYPLEWLGYVGFFWWVVIATIPSFLVTAIIYFRIDPAFGRPEEAAA